MYRSNIYNETYITKEYIDELWGKFSWGTRAWGWRVASFVEICFYVCMFVRASWSHAWNIQHSLWIQSTMHPDRILKSCISVGLMNKNKLQCFPWDTSDKKTSMHGNFGIVGIWGLMFCFIAGGRLTVSDELPCCIDFPEYFVKSLEYRFDWSSTSLKQGPIQMLAPDRQIQIENPIVR